MRTIQFVLFVAMIFTIACTPKTEEAIEDKTAFTEKNIDPTSTQKVAEFYKKDVLDLDKRLAKNIIETRFKNLDKVQNIELKQFKFSAPYYLIAKGEIGGEPVLVAMELLRKGGELHASEYNTLHTTCIAKSCESCDFRIDKNGEIEDCGCESETEFSENSACEHRMFIKTLEKEF